MSAARRPQVNPWQHLDRERARWLRARQQLANRGWSVSLADGSFTARHTTGRVVRASSLIALERGIAGELSLGSKPPMQLELPLERRDSSCDSSAQHERCEPGQE